MQGVGDSKGGSWTSCGGLTSCSSNCTLSFLQQPDNQHEMICRAVYTFSGLSVEDCCYLLMNPVELPIWLNFVQRVQPDTTSDTGDPSKKPHIWKTREGFPYGGSLLRINHLIVERGGGKGVTCDAGFVPDVNTLDDDADHMLIRPRVVMHVSSGSNNTMAAMLVYKLVLKSALTTLPGSVASKFLQAYAAYSSQVAFKRLQSRATMLAAGIVSRNSGAGGLGGMLMSGEPQSTLGFPLMDEILVKSIPFEGTGAAGKPADYVEGLILATKDVLDAIGCGDAPPPRPRMGGISMDTTPGSLQPYMDLLFQHCAAASKKMRSAAAALPLLPDPQKAPVTEAPAVPPISALFVTHNPMASMEDVKMLEAMQFSITLCTFDEANKLLHARKAIEKLHIVLCESRTDTDQMADMQTLNVLEICRQQAQEALPVVVLAAQFSQEHLQAYIASDATTFLLTPLVKSACQCLFPYIIQRRRKVAAATKAESSGVA
eukprot:CAMPEP_0118923186 /NCGR_PEP_ID=MMETSP1169-20130426/1807_1 /TAXON_ID=36882 /ORGANISM="Pyramimonas obovata, Strain CCMP722" /LENGTH=487 /DNA_ID=CAMNT_0006864139 /DNA_START=223 /DNA_END=1683 /DNA_ORIENTATION=-